jgi:thiamine-monophosphate kinase
MMARPSEDDLIARFFAPLAGPGGLALEDDAARLAAEPGFDLILTCDALVAGVHFFADDPPEAIAAKALRVNLSDLAAKGARPAGFLLALALPRNFEESWLARFAAGLEADIAAYDCPLLGGDTVATPGPLMISITALGHVPAGRMVPRTGARPGDFLYVSGTIGDAALGLQVRLGALAVGAEEGAFLGERYLRPQPRNALAGALVAHANGAMDISDGFAGDLRKMLRVSGAGARVDVARVPLSAAARAVIAREPKRLAQALTGGDDYEILASVHPAQAAAFEASAASAGVAVTRVGVVTDEAGPPQFVGDAGQIMDFTHLSYSHF